MILHVRVLDELSSEWLRVKRKEPVHELVNDQIRPFMAMLNELAEKNSGLRFPYLYGGKSQLKSN